jgi:CRISPR type III-A-associated RAMP protein Csm5
MNQAKITALTPIHIGSGIQAMRDADYLYFEKLGKAIMLDADKVLGIIGEENVGQWTGVIEKNAQQIGTPNNKETLYDLLAMRKKDLSPEDVALRVLNVRHAGLDKKSELKEQLHNGMNVPLLPGSSIKGAVRTALFAHFVNKNNGNDVRDSQNLTNYKRQFSDAQLIKKYFGDDPNHDMLRLLKIMDTHFSQTECYRAETINLKNKAWEVDARFTQFLEAIPAKSTAFVNFQFDETTERNAQKQRFFRQNTSLLRPEKLFEIINDHTRDLAEREIKYWVEQDEPDVLGFYLEKLREFVEEIKILQPGECIFRLGWGTGFRNMTGDWHINMTDDDYYDLVKSLRPRHPEDMAYPKTMRILKDGTPLGFVKLTAI